MHTSRCDNMYLIFYQNDESIPKVFIEKPRIMKIYTLLGTDHEKITGETVSQEMKDDY